MERSPMSRRDFLKIAGLGTAAAVGGLSACGESTPQIKEGPLTDEAILTSNRKDLRRFGYQKEIPTPPGKLMHTLTLARERGYTTLDAHYLPKVTFTEHTDEYPGWQRKPDSLFWGDVQNRRNPDAQGEPKITMGGYWVLVDGIKDNRIETDRKFPEYWNATKDTPYTYKDDPLANLLTELRETQDLGRIRKKASRCDFSWNQLHNLVLPKIATEFGLKDHGGTVRLMTGTEVNLLGNIFCPEWDHSVAAQLLETWTYGIGLYDRPEENDIASVATDLTSITVPFTSRSFGDDKTGFRPFVVFPTA